MDPFNHSRNSHATHTHHHSRRDDDEQPPPTYPPPGNAPPFSSFNNPYQPPPQQPPHFYGDPHPPPPSRPETQVFHTGHVSHDFNDYAPPPPHPSQSHHHQQVPDHSYNNHGYPAPPPAFADYSAPPPPAATVHHVSHETHNFPTSSVHHVGHQGPTPTPTALSGKPTFRVVTKANPDYALTVRQGQVILAHFNPSNDHQLWYKDEKYSTRVKDKEGCPAFSLVNKATGEAIKHSIGETHPVRLIPYKPDYLDESILWTESKDLGDSYRAVRMVNNIHLNVDAYHGDKSSGGVHDGTTVVLWQWNKGDNQRWKIVPYSFAWFPALPPDLRPLLVLVWNLQKLPYLLISQIVVSTPADAAEVMPWAFLTVALQLPAEPVAL